MEIKLSSLLDLFKSSSGSNSKVMYRSFEASSVVHKFNIFFVLIALIPLGVMLYFYYQVSQDGRVAVTRDQLNTALIIVVVGIGAGYIAMRALLKNLVDVTAMSVNKMREFLGPEKIHEFLQGDENEIAVLTRTFSEITNRLEENINVLQATKKTLHSVLNRVGQGISTMRNIDTFFDLIVETTTEALGGKKGFLFLQDKDTNHLAIKTVYGTSLKDIDKKHFSIETSPFAPAIHSRTALIIPKIQYLAKDGQGSSHELDYPMICAPLILHDEVLGILAVSGRKSGDSFNEEEMTLLFNLATQTAVAIENSQLSENAGKTYFETLTALAMAVEARDPYSRGHLERVGQYCIAVAQYMGLPTEEVGHLRDAAKLHDIGKIGVSDDVLSKQGPLTEHEWVIMKKHPEIGESIVSSISSLKPLCDIIRHHHEKLDGSGYPDRLKGAQISLPVRILSVADIYDALTTDRPYRKAMPRHQAEAVLRAMVEEVDQKVVDTLFVVTSKP
jgi:HD-GYP domain-containing protein (c-di-GMP phosphodiesterase class II)